MNRLPLLFTLVFASPTLADSPKFDSVASILIKNCVRCHHPGDKKNGLNMSTRELLLKGGDAGPAININEPSASLIVRRAANGSMPPINDGPQVPSADVKLLRDWITAGAHWPAGQTLTPTGIRRSTPDPTSRRKRFRRRFRLRRFRRC